MAKPIAASAAATVRINNVKIWPLKSFIKIENEIKGLKKINKNSSPDLTTRLKHMVTSVNGDRTQKGIREFVDNSFLARDSRPFREYASNIMPDINLDFDITFEDGTTVEDVTIPIGVGFFWPDASV